MELSSRIEQVSASPTLGISAEAGRLRAQGEDVISLGAGEPDFATPQHIKKAGREAIKAGMTNYTDTQGTKELREVVAETFTTEKSVAATADEVIISPGAKYALFLALQAIVNAEEEVILPAPYWVTYPEQVKFSGGKIKAVETREADGFKLTGDKLEAAVTDQTRAVILNTPCNPTGAVYTQEELAELAAVAVANDIYVVADEIYNKICYDEPVTSIASLGAEIKERTITIDGVSKSYAMTGWRIGFAVGPEKVINAMNCLQSHSTSNANSIAQQASIAALSGPQEPVAEMRVAFKERRDIMIERINQMPGFSVHQPQGAFYLFVNVKDLLGTEINGQQIATDKELADLFLQQAGVATIPGSFFGRSGYLRLSYAAAREKLTEAVNRIENILA